MTNGAAIFSSGYERRVLSFSTLTKGTNNVPLQCNACYIAKLYFVLSTGGQKEIPNKKDMLLFSSHHTIFCLLSIRYHSYWLTHVTPSHLFIQCKTFLNYDKYKKYTWL